MSAKTIDITELESLLEEGKSIAVISKHFNVARSTIRSRIDRFNLQDKKLSYQNHLKAQYCRYFMKLNGAKKIGKIMHTSPLNVKEVLKEFNLKILSSGKWTKLVNHVKNKNFDLPISSYLHEVITGQLLGDRCLGLQMKGKKEFLNILSYIEYKNSLSFLRSLQNDPIKEIGFDLIKN